MEYMGLVNSCLLPVFDNATNHSFRYNDKADTKYFIDETELLDCPLLKRMDFRRGNFIHIELYK